MADGFRFLHASDFHLERAVGGVTELPESWESLLAAAPARAARQVFDLAIEHEADALLLAGDIMDARLAGPAGVDFLRQNFRRLEKKGIAVYWVAGEAEHRGPWPVKVALPENVTLVHDPKLRVVTWKRDDQPVAKLLLRSVAEGGRAPLEGMSGRRGDLPHVALAYGRTDRSDFRAARLNYFALGGRHHPGRIAGVARRWEARYCGPPQAFGASSPGPRGCVLGEIHELGHVRCRFLPTDQVRWYSERLDCGDRTSLAELAELAAKRLDTLQNQLDGRYGLVRWQCAVPGPLGYHLRQRGGELRFLSQTRDEKRWPNLWSSTVETSLTDGIAQRAEEDTILGEFLRAVGQWKQHPERIPDPSGWVSEDADCQLLREFLPATGNVPARFLAQLEALGFDLLQPPPELEPEAA